MSNDPVTVYVFRDGKEVGQEARTFAQMGKPPITITLPNNLGVMQLDRDTLQWVPVEGNCQKYCLAANLISKHMGWSPGLGRPGFAQAVRITREIPGSVAHIPPDPELPGVIY